MQFQSGVFPDFFALCWDTQPIVSYISNTDNLYPIDKSTLPTVRFDPSDSCYLPSDNVLPMATLEVCKYRLSYERRGDISFIARGTISYFVTSERSERGTKYDIVTRAIKLILPSLECDNLFITYLCLYLGQKSDYIFTLFIL